MKTNTRMGCTGHVARTEMRTSCKTSKKREHLEDVQVDVTVILKIIARGIGYEVTVTFSHLKKTSAGTFFCQQGNELVAF
jgi:hypothetical protein